MEGDGSEPTHSAINLMELNDFEKINPVTKEFRGLAVTFNPDALTDGFFFAVAERVRQRYTDEVKSVIAPDPVPAAPVDKDMPIEAQAVLTFVNTLADRIKLEGDKIQGEKEFFIALLVGTADSPVLLEWDLTNKGVPVPCNENGLRTLQKKTLEDLWHFVREGADPKSQGIETIPQSQTMSETTQLRSASPETPPEDAPIM